MPNLLVFGPYKIYFWSNEGSEPIHVHVSIKRASKMSAKFWILKDGSVELANNHAGFSRHTIQDLASFIESNIPIIESTWMSFFATKQIKYFK